MNAPVVINHAHRALQKNSLGLTLDEICGKLRCKANKASHQIRELSDAGLIVTEEDAGQPVFRLITIPAAESEESAAKTVAETTSPGDSEGGETDAPLNFVGHQAPAPALTAEQRAEFTLLGVLADIRAAIGDPTGKIMLGELAEHIREELTHANGVAGAACVVLASIADLLGVDPDEGGPEPIIQALTEKDKTIAELRERLDAQIKQGQADTGRLTSDLRAAMESRSQTINEADRLRAELAAERQAREALQEQAARAAFAQVDEQAARIAALEAELKAAREQTPVAWMYDWQAPEGLIRDWVTSNQAEIPKHAINIRPLYARPVPAEQPANARLLIQALTEESAEAGEFMGTQRVVSLEFAKHSITEAQQAGPDGSLTLDKDEVAFLAARVRRLLAKFSIHEPEKNDRFIIGIAGSLIGNLLTNIELKEKAGPVRLASQQRITLLASYLDDLDCLNKRAAAVALMNATEDAVLRNNGFNESSEAGG